MWKLLQIFLLLSALMIGGCVKYHRRPISPSDEAFAFQSRSLDAPEVRRMLELNLKHPFSEWPAQNWDLPMLTVAALYYQPDLDVARAQWLEAKAAVVTAGARPNPQLEATPQFSPWAFDFNIDFTFQTGGKISHRRTQAMELAQAARLSVAMSAWNARNKLADALTTYTYAADQKEILDHQIEVQKEIVQMLEQRVQLGAASQPELTQSHISLQQMQLLMHDQSRQMAEAFARTAQTIGVPSVALRDRSLDLAILKEQPNPDSLSIDGLRRTALLGRSDILKGLAQYAAAEARLRLEIAKQYPDVHIGPGYKWEDGDNEWTIKFTLPIPVFNRNEGPIAEAEAHRSQAAALFFQLQSSLAGETERALAAYRASYEKYNSASDLVLNQQKLFQSMKIQFEHGEVDRLALRSSELELRQAELSKALAAAESAHALNQLEDALQHPLRTDDLQAIDPKTWEVNPGSQR